MRSRSVRQAQSLQNGITGNPQSLVTVHLDSTQTVPVVVQRSVSESSTLLERDQMPKHCDRVKWGFPAATAKGIVGQSCEC
jgi:hypothetical protein